MSTGDRQFLVFTAGLVAIIPISIALTWLVSPGVGMAVSIGGTFLWLLGALLYVVFVDSKKRWPKASAFTRLSYVITFKP